MKQPSTIRPATGKLGILLPGLGAVASTTITGVLLARRGLGRPVGSLTQMGTIRLGKRTEGRTPAIRELIPLQKLEDIAFGAWDIFPDDAAAVADHAEVLEKKHIDAVRDELSQIRPMKGAFNPEYVKRLHGTHVKTAATKADLVEQLREDVRTFKKESGADRLVFV